MKPKPIILQPNIMAALCLGLVSAATSYARSTISYDGAVHYIGGDTILLDREGLFSCPDAVADPADAFSKIDSLGSNAVLLVAPSVYWLDDPDDPAVRSDKGGTPYAVRLTCDSLSIIGLSDNPQDVVFAVNRGQTQGAVGNFTMFHFAGKSLELENVTFGNYCNVDLVYPRDHAFDRPKRKDAIVQAQIGICGGTDRLLAVNCRFISRLNLCPFVGARRSLYDRCYFECTDDALSGSAIYLDCDFTFFSSKPFYSTSETGAVFLDCDITCLGSGVQYFTKVPGQVTAIDTRFFCKNPIDIKWTRDSSDIICLQENISLNGLPYEIDSSRPELSLDLKSTPLRRAYKIDSNGSHLYNIPNLLNGDDGWDPLGLNGTFKDLEAQTGQKLTGIPVALRVTSDAPEHLYNGNKVAICSQPLLWGGYPSGQPDVFDFVAENTQPLEKRIVVPVSTPDGLAGRQTLTVQPNLRKAPEFRKKPAIRFDKSTGRLVADYALKGKGDDASTVLWGRVVDYDGHPQVLLTTAADAPEGRSFTPKAGDLGYGIVAIVTPKFKDSRHGMPEASRVFDVADPEDVRDLPESTLSTDFSDIYIQRREAGYPGVWSFDVFKPADTSHVEWQPAEGSGWYYGKGFDASTGIGLVQSEKGARMSYVPARDTCRDMTVSLIAEPAKSGGQGFGSATSQYMDICVKFDPVGLNGYALRIERTPDYDHAVRFSLIRYDKGLTSVISDEVISDCFRNPCHINVGIADGLLHASAYTEAGRSSDRAEILEKVELTAPVDSSTDTGFCIQHTGSVGPSSTLLRDLSIEWR